MSPAQLAQGSPTSFTASDFSCSTRCWLQLQLVWPPSTSMARPSTPSSACPPEQSSRTWWERDSPSCSRHSQRSSISSLTRCQWWGGRSLARLTDVSTRPSLTTPRRCLEDAPVFSSDSFLQSWTCPSTPPTLALSPLTRGEQPTRPSSWQWYWTRSCGWPGPEQVKFRDILLRLRDAKVTLSDWNHLMSRTPTRVQDLSPFSTALHLIPTVEAVVEYNVAQLQASGQPIAAIKAVHTGANAAKAPADDAGGLEAVVCLAHSARVMLTSNLWVDVGLVNGAMGTVQAICYRTGGPPDLPIAIMVRFDSYSGPTFPDGTVPITPLRRCWSSSGGGQCSRLQLPLKLAWAVTIHKSQGLTLDKVVVDVGKREFSTGLTFVACSRVRQLQDLLFTPPFTFQRLSSLSNSCRLKERQEEDQRLLSLQLPQRPPQDKSHASAYRPLTNQEQLPVLACLPFLS